MFPKKILKKSELLCAEMKFVVSDFNLDALES